MLRRTDRLFFSHLCSLLTCPVACAYSSLLFVMRSKFSLLVQKLPVIAHLIPASVINKSKREAGENLCLTPPRLAAENSTHSGRFDMLDVNAMCSV